MLKINSINDFFEIEDAHFRRSQKKRRMENLQIEKYKAGLL